MGDIHTLNWRNMSPNFDALRRHVGYFWIILGVRCMMGSIMTLMTGALVLESFAGKEIPIVIVLILFGFAFAGGGLIAVGGYTARDLVSREFTVNWGTYLDSVRGAQLQETTIIVWKDVLIPGHRKELRP